MSPTLWFDVEDMFEYARSNARPSGIQRMSFQIYAAMQQQWGGTGRIRFVRYGADRQSFVPVTWEALDHMFHGIANGHRAPDAPDRKAPVAAVVPVRESSVVAKDAVRVPAGHPSPFRRLIRSSFSCVPDRIRKPLVLFAVLQLQAILALLQAGAAAGPAALRYALHRLQPMAYPRAVHVPTPRHRDEAAALLRPGDVLIVLGSPWANPYYAGLVERLRRELGIRFAVLVYDIVPLRRPEWCDRSLVQVFRNWYASVLPLADVVFSISRATAGDLERYADSHGVALQNRVQPIPVGTGFGNTAQRWAATMQRHPALPEAGSYVLFVSTIEARKNHTLLFSIWRKMVEELPPAEVPTLVLAGRVGWLVADLMQQLENARYLDGKIQLVRGPTDEMLHQLYSGCLFTVFPSLFEGWGLPVTESLALGKPCIAANRTSMPEAGGSLARYFDPESLSDAYRVIRTAIEDRVGLAAWEEQVRREFRPVPWDETAGAIMRRLEATAPAAA